MYFKIIIFEDICSYFRFLCSRMMVRDDDFLKEDKFAKPF